MSSSEIKVSLCPICNKDFPLDCIEGHVEKCLFLNSENDKTLKRQHQEDSLSKSPSIFAKKPRGSRSNDQVPSTSSFNDRILQNGAGTSLEPNKPKPLAEKMRPTSLETFIGQEHILGETTVLRHLIEQYNFPSMILWGPPGCGKTSLANIIQRMCMESPNYRFVKMSATTAGVNDVKEAVQVARNELQMFKRKTVVFMDEIHRFNKLQQDIFLPTVENGLITLIGATTENPSFSLNNALLSRCRVFVLEKLKIEDIVKILSKSAHELDVGIHEEINEKAVKKYIVKKETIVWLAEISDGDARIALNSFQMAVESKKLNGEENNILISLDDIKDGVKKSHLLYDRKGEEHYNMISALHKSIRASDDNAALYWLTRMLEGGEDPLFIARRLVRAASEDIGLSDPMALTLAVSTMQGCQLIGMPECDVLLAQTAVYLARTYKSQEVYRALLAAKDCIKNHKGPLPAVPLHLRNAPTKLMKDLGYAKGYNMQHKDVSNLIYMPQGLESLTFFKKE